MPEQPRPTMIEISAIASLSNINETDQAVIDMLSNLMKSKVVGDLQDLRNDLHGRGYDLVGPVRDDDEDEAEDLDLYALVRIIDESGNEIPPEVIDQELEARQLAMVTFQIR